LNISRGLLYGYGVNDIKDSTKGEEGKVDKIYRAWSGVMQRCFSERFKSARPSYLDCTVCDEWLIFSNFKSWYIENTYESDYHLELDKDLKSLGNKLYSPETCLLLEPHVNNLLVGFIKPRGRLPLGVAEYKDRKKRFRCQVNMGEGQVQCGAFYTELEAHKVWQENKVKRILELATKAANPVVREALINFASLISRDIELGKESKFN